MTQTKHPKPDITIMTGCGYAGQTDKKFSEYAKYIADKSYKVLSNNLNSSELYDQLLSAISLEELSLQKKLTLTEKEKELISKIKASTKTYYLCQGCTGHYYYKIKDLFSNNPEDKTLLDHLKVIKYNLGFKVDF